MKKILLAILSLALVVALLGVAFAATSAVSTLDNYAALVTAAGGIALPDAPQGATDVQYSLLQGAKPIAQMRFKLDGVSYHLRACACADAASAGDISGMKAVFSANELKEVKADDGQSYQLGVAGKSALAEWYSEAKKCEYSLLSDAATDGFQTFVDTVRKSAETIETVQEQGTSLTGTVKKIGKKSVALIDDKGTSYTFAISSRTVNPDSKKIKKKAVVRVNYAGEYASGCEALSISLVSEAGGGKTTKPTQKPKPTATPKPDKAFKASGVVTMSAGNMFELQTGKGELMAFLIEDASVKGAENAEVGNKVSVVYNIKNSCTHLVSVEFVHVEPTPTPAPPSHTVSGTIQYIDTQSLTLMDDSSLYPYEFDIATAKLKGDLDAGEGDDARVTYFESEDGALIATVVVLSRDIPIDDVPAPEPIDDPVEPDEETLF